MINKNEIVKFILLQHELVKALFNTYPMAKDTEWLLDFPKKGYIQINSDVWNFTKHGSGIRFFMNSFNANEIVDVHNNISHPELVDTWRLSQYFSFDDESQLRLLLNDMASSGELEKLSNNLYRLKGIST